MSTRRVVNPYHPHAVFLDAQLRYKKIFRSQSNDNLRKLLSDYLDLEQPMPRHEMLKLLFDHRCKLFKQEWEQHMGWPFDDCYDPLKYSEHLRAMKLRLVAQQAENQPAPVAS